MSIESSLKNFLENKESSKYFFRFPKINFTISILGTLSTWLHQFRHWLRYMETKLQEAELYDAVIWFNCEFIEQRLLDQQVRNFFIF